MLHKKTVLSGPSHTIQQRNKKTAKPPNPTPQKTPLSEGVHINKTAEYLPKIYEKVLADYKYHVTPGLTNRCPYRWWKNSWRLSRTAWQTVITFISVSSEHSVSKSLQKNARNISKDTTLIVPAHKAPSFKPSYAFKEIPEI